MSVNHHGGLSTTTSLLTDEEQQLLLPLHESVLPVMEVPESDNGTVYIISILRDGLSYLVRIYCISLFSTLLLTKLTHGTFLVS